jgi:putative spermidine/putrescine transport system ATP-binding protein
MSKDLGITALHVTHDQEEAITLADRIVVLRKGKIIQKGTPREIYENPVSPFIQHFVGEANFFSGTIIAKEDPETIVKCDGLSIHARQSDLPIGTEVCVGVKTEVCSVSKEAREGRNAIIGTVERELFLGRLSGLEISTEYGNLKAKIPAAVSSIIEEGQEVTLRFDGSQAIVFPIPEGGLEKELEVE